MHFGSECGTCGGTVRVSTVLDCTSSEPSQAARQDTCTVRKSGNTPADVVGLEGESVLKSVVHQKLFPGREISLVEFQIEILAMGDVRCTGNAYNDFRLLNSLLRQHISQVPLPEQGISRCQMYDRLES